MMEHFEQALARTILVEGGYANDPADSGGETMWGVTKETARAAGYIGPMREMPRAVAEAIYRRSYWEPLKLAAIAALSPALAYELFDSAVNIGPGVVAKWLQRWLNALNDGGKLYPDLEVDGQIGPATLGALREFLSRRGHLGERVLLAGLNALQAVHYLELSEKRPKDERFLFGWLRQRVVEK